MLVKHLKQNIGSWLFSKIPVYILEKITRTHFIIPYYHIVNNDEVLHVKHLYDYKNIDQFISDLDFLIKNYVPVTLNDVLDFIKNDRFLPERSFLLTFDDGFREMYDVVAPILLKKGIPATFFVNSAFLDNKELFYQHKASILAECFQHKISDKLTEEVRKLLKNNELDCNDIPSSILSIKYQKKNLLEDVAKIIDIDFNDYLSESQPYLTSDQIESMIKNGFTIGAHSIDHPLYSSLSLRDQLHQTIESVKQIRSRFCLDYGAFAFPHSDHKVTTEFFEELYNSGLVDISFGTSGMINDSYSNNLQRFSLEKPLMPAKRIIALQFARKFIKILTGNSKIIRH